MPALSILTEEEKREAIRDTHRFDLRRFLGMLFVIYGVLVTAMGIANPAADKAPTGGIPINLYTGVSMLVVGSAFFVWDHLAPVADEEILRHAAQSKAQAMTVDE
ncbi:hypothetical protein SAMN05443377_12816 [Propionibacterium cyclohexanicum]|uniref:Uncharacterized protein n=2 Tax=Propionibacterium cyclohexanicum TaxID=64702 RepID=A0A1H9TU54_9ACTN|nr:hypothetical protein SAMN05443377_12816 [Propionibacterium cyclohexanicum]